jgi:hypothetical protein
VASGAIRVDLGDIGSLLRGFAMTDRLATVIVEMVRGSVATKADVQALGAELKAAVAALRYLPPHSG